MKVTNINPKFASFLQQRRLRVNALLERHLRTITSGGPKKLGDAIRYVVLNGGKRIRPLLVYAVGKAYQASMSALDAPACAIELIHSFSLVHDDLPAMDNDSLRRGKPTCHLAFNEATAILAGDTLAIGALKILSEDKILAAEKKMMMSKILAEASGPRGMAGGQYLDLDAVGKKLSARQLEQMYLLKTGALIRAAVKLGAIAANINAPQELKKLDQFALNIGLAFQIQDDVLNIESTSQELGKNVGTDSASNKITYPALVGLPKAKEKINLLWHKAGDALQKLKTKNNILSTLTAYIMERDF